MTLMLDATKYKIEKIRAFWVTAETQKHSWPYEQKCTPSVDTGDGNKKTLSCDYTIENIIMINIWLPPSMLLPRMKWA